MPLEYMLAVMRNPSPKISDARRDWAAQAAAPYCHARLNNIDVGVKNETLDELAKLVTGVMKAGKGVGGLRKGG